MSYDKEISIELQGSYCTCKGLVCYLRLVSDEVNFIIFLYLFHFQKQLMYMKDLLSPIIEKFDSVVSKVTILA